VQLFKRRVPLTLCLLVGVLFFFQYYVPHPWSQKALTDFNNWILVATGFTFVLGLVSILRVHTAKIRRRGPGWAYSVVMFAGLLATFSLGMWSRGNTLDPVTDLRTPLGWIYTYVQYPLQATMFAVLGFYVASAAFRTFRLKSLEAGILMAAAMALIFGRVPLGEELWSRMMGYASAKAPLHPQSMNSITEWILSVPSMAGKRGILLGISLGAIAMSLKVILGIERAYLGGGKDA
jgi:hypothetical protein